MREQVNFPRLYRADMVFPPWAGHLAWAPPLSMRSAALEGEQR
jgi:hypothetical protein